MTEYARVKLGNIRVTIFPNFQKRAWCEKYLKMISTKATNLLRENMLGYLSLDIICSSKLTVFLELRFGNCSLLGADNFRGQFKKLMIHQIVSLARNWSKLVT